MTSTFRISSPGFDARRLRLARVARGLTKQELAELIGVSAGAVSQYERSGSYAPNREVVAKLALALGFPKAFFTSPHAPIEVPPSHAHFRSLRATTQRERQQALSFVSFLSEVVDAIETRVRLPALNLPSFPLGTNAGSESVEQAAAHARRELGLEPGPVAHVVRTLEAAGVVVGTMHAQSERVNAFSVHMANTRPVVVLTSNKGDAARSRMDAAHELGHLVQHDDVDAASQVVERQANEFASAFLMPANEIRAFLPRRFDLDALLELKQVWGVSLGALLYRSRSLGVIAESTYRRAMVRISSNRWPDGTSWRTREPAPVGEPEEPTMVRDAYRLAIEGTKNGDPFGLNLPVDVVDAIIG